MTSWTVTMAKWLSYCRASGRIWVTRARVAVGLAMDYQTVPSISSAPLELLIEGVFDRHLPWKSAFRQRTAMWELRLRIQHYAPPCLMWQQSYVSWQLLLLLLQIWQRVCHACIQTSCPSTRVCLWTPDQHRLSWFHLHLALLACFLWTQQQWESGAR